MSGSDGVTPDSDSVGYSRPPQSSRFTKGRSGNPKGRPAGRRNEIPYDSVLGQMVTIREDGRERRVTAAEAFILQLTGKGLQGDSASARASLAAIEAARAVARPHTGVPTGFRIIYVSSGVCTVLRDLGLGVKLHPFSEERVRWSLQPWIVEAALARLGLRHLTTEEQRVVWDVTRTPQKVAWPEWWKHFG